MSNMYNKAISILVCFTFLFTNISYAEAPTYQNLAARLISQDPDQQDVVKAAAARLTAMKYDDVLKLDEYPKNFIVTEGSQLGLVGVDSLTPNYDDLPEEWKKFASKEWREYKSSVKTDSFNMPLPDHFLQLSDPITALKFFAKNEAHSLGYEVKDVVEGWFPYDGENGEVPIAGIESNKDGTYTIIVHTEFVQRWRHIRRRDVWLEIDDVAGKKRVVSYAWALLFWVAKHEMSDLRSKPDRGPKGGGHIFKGLSSLLIEKTANNIGGRYAEVNEAMRLAFLQGYCVNQPHSFTEEGFKARARWVLTPSDENSPKNNRLEEEFPKISSKRSTDQEIDIQLAFLTHYLFSTQGDRNREIWAKPITTKVPEYLIEEYEKRQREHLGVEKPFMKATGSDEDETQHPGDIAFKKVLMVDDDKYTYMTMKIFLNRAGIKEIVFVETYEEARAKLKESIDAGAPFDLIITDGNLPVTSDDLANKNENATGVQVVLAARELSNDYKDVPAILISGKEQKEIEETHKTLTGSIAPQELFVASLVKGDFGYKDLVALLGEISTTDEIDVEETVEEMPVKEESTQNSKLSAFSDISIISRDPEKFGGFAAAKVTEEIVSLQRDPERSVNIVLATGNTMTSFLHALASEEEIDWDRVRIFHLDEYRLVDDSGRSSALERDHKASFAYFIYKNLISRVETRLNRKLRATNIHYIADYINGGAGIDQYMKALEMFGGADVVMLGTGVDGHLAFNEAGSSFDSTMKEVVLSKSTIEANRADYQQIEEQPYAYTMGIKDILTGRKLFFLARTSRKKPILKKALISEVTAEVPASVLQTCPEKVTVILDEDAAGWIDELPKSFSSSIGQGEGRIFEKSYTYSGLDISFNIVNAPSESKESFITELNAIGLIDVYLLNPFAEHIRARGKWLISGSEPFKRAQYEILLFKQGEGFYFKIVDTVTSSYVEGTILPEGAGRRLLL